MKAMFYLFWVSDKEPLVECSFNGCSSIDIMAQVHVLLGMKISHRDLPPRETRCKNYCSFQWATFPFPPPPNPEANPLTIANAMSLIHQHKCLQSLMVLALEARC